MISKVHNLLTGQHFRPIISNLYMNNRRSFFGLIPNLIKPKNEITKLKALCSIKKIQNRYDFRKNNSADLVLIRKEEKIEVLSKDTFYHSKKNN